MKQPLLLIIAILLSHLAFGQTFKEKTKKTTQPTFKADVTIHGEQSFYQNSNTTVSAKYPGIPGSLRQKLAQGQQPENSLNAIQAISEKGLPTFIKTQSNGTENTMPSTASAAVQASFDYLNKLKSLIQIKQPSQEFEVKDNQEDALGHRHVKLQQSYQGVPIYASEVIIHFNPNGQKLFNGSYHATPAQISITPGINDSLAILATIRDVSVVTHYRPLRTIEKKIHQYDGPEVELVLYEVPYTKGQLKLTYHVTIKPNFVERYEYFIDAQNGNVLHSYDHTCTLGPKTGSSSDLNGVARSFGIYEDGSNVNYMIDASKSMFTGAANQLPSQGDGIIMTGDMNNTGTNNPSFFYVTSNNANSWSASEVSAHYNAGVAFDYFKNTHGRNSINGTGGDILSFVNVADDNGNGLDNAFWDGKAIYYGNGASAFDPLAGALDVAGHEMSHGTVQETAGLEYQGESGALNESFADIFGVMIDRNDWTLGEDVVKLSAFPSGALRSMSDPHNGGNSRSDPGWQPKRYSERYTGSQDNGGVHINSGIPNHAFYLYAQSVGKDKAEDTYFRALAMYLTRSSDFKDARLAVQQAAIDLFGNNSTELMAAETAFSTVEMPGSPASGGGGGTGGPKPDLKDLPINPGQDYIVSTDVNTADVNTLYRSSTAATNFAALSTTEHKKRISIRDDGAFGYLVGTDDHVYELSLDPNNINEQIISTTAEWDNAVISKDGTKMAAITTSIDTSIIVFDFVNNRAARFVLYNPTFSQGVNNGGVLYADALEWDHSGQFVMYDAFNRIPGTLGDDVEYWDVGFLNVWDNSADNWGTGEVTKLFTQLDAGISVGNPVFSSNSPYIVAFDLVDNNQNQYTITGANIETGEVESIFTQATLGYPDYSNRDDKIVFAAEDQSGGKVVAEIGLANDKITPAGQATSLIPDGTYPIWYATGIRDLLLSVEDGLVEKSLGAIAYPNPVKNELNLRYELETTASVKISLYDLSGKLIRTLAATAPQGRGTHEIKTNLGDLPAGKYFVSLQAGNHMQSITILKR